MKGLARPIMTTIRPGALILGYHRVAETNWDPYRLCIHPANFLQHLQILMSRFKPVSLRTLAENLREGKDVRDMAAITFDDGYRDFIDNAMPELNRLGIPATVFVTTGFIGQPFWWDEIAQLVHPDTLESSELELAWNDSTNKLIFRGMRDRARAAHATREICRVFRHSSDGVREDLMKQIRAWRGAKDGLRVPSRVLSEDELRGLSKYSGKIEIASHTVTHPMLAGLKLDQQRQEITASRACLENLTDRLSVTGFSYPNGSFSQQTCQLLADLGFEYGCTSKQGVLRQGSDPYRLPRIWSPNWGKHGFWAWLSTWRGFH
jgi:peptidoglycan/xylan/chitin deacetylase (PgdA/CDA1 family)